LFFVVFCLLNSLAIAQACPPEATQVQVLDRFGGNQWVDAFTPVSDGNTIYPLSTLGPYNPTAYFQYLFYSTGAAPTGPLCYSYNVLQSQLRGFRPSHDRRARCRIRLRRGTGTQMVLPAAFRGNLRCWFIRGYAWPARIQLGHKHWVL
jgi:hypothetical protein